MLDKSCVFRQSASEPPPCWPTRPEIFSYHLPLESYVLPCQSINRSRWHSLCPRESASFENAPHHQTSSCYKPGNKEPSDVGPTNQSISDTMLVVLHD